MSMGSQFPLERDGLVDNSSEKCHKFRRQASGRASGPEGLQVLVNCLHLKQDSSILLHGLTSSSGRSYVRRTFEK